MTQQNLEYLWSLPPEHQRMLIAISLDRYGKVVGELHSPNSQLYTLDAGPDAFPRYCIAKALSVNNPQPDYRARLERVLIELNNVYSVCHHPRVQRFTYVELVMGVLFVISRKRDMTLYDVTQRGALSVAQTLCVAIQIAHALNYCARCGIRCHQDLKPENIFLDETARQFGAYPVDYLVFVGDLELANAYYALGRPYGSRPYMASEQYFAAKPNAPRKNFDRIDVFALGVLLVEMLTGGMHPVGQKRSLLWPEPAEEFRKWKHENPWKAWARGGATVVVELSAAPAEMEQLIRRCLKTDWAQRPTMTELEAELRRLLEGLDSNLAGTMGLLLAQGDEAAAVNESGGWPYMDELMRKLNTFFANSDPHSLRAV